MSTGGSSHERVSVHCGFIPAQAGIFEKLVQRGKTKKQALQAFAHKLIRQAFAVLKKGVEYREKLALGIRGGT